MAHTVIYNPDTAILEITYQGAVTLAEVKEIYKESAQAVKEHHCHLIFSDYREAVMKLSTVEIYDLPKILADTLRDVEVAVVSLKRALVVAKDLRDYHFYETVTHNQGQNTRIFQDVAEAKEWLTSDPA